MDDRHRFVIQSNYASLVEQTDLHQMVSALYQKGVFSDHMIERYKDQRFDVRHRKRQLYMDLMTRGPYAFQHLIDALTEEGYWNLARDLDPNSPLHTNSIGNRRPPSIPPNDDYVSLCTKNKKKTKSGPEVPKNESRPPHKQVESENILPEIPQFHIQKCTKFVEDDDTERGIKVYRTRGRHRGVLLVFSCTKFLNNIEEARAGVEVDNLKLKYLFNELGFKVLFYTNLPKDEMVSTLKSLNEVLGGVECVFVVVSSHGYGRVGSYDNDFRCHDGQLMSSLEFLEYFNNKNLSALRGVPKVFIFQICRGSAVDWQEMPMPQGGGARADGRALADTTRAPPHPPLPPLPAPKRERIYSDILIAHSTVPGDVSWRDVKNGSWYIQTLCEVFAAHAHETHVEELFTLVDKRLGERYRIQTSSVDRWGFNCRLYLHPGLYE